MYRQTMNRNAGFTLIELSIVLVIIGLIVGGVLVGQDLIKAAEVRATVGQVEKYNSSMNTFRTKYNGMPGDLLSTSAANFGMTVRTGAAGHGDGNSLVEGCSAGAIVFGCETALIWVDLSFANLIDGSFTTATDALTQVAAGSQTSYFPSGKVGRGNYFTVYSSGGLNHYEVTGVTSTSAAGVYTLTTALTPTESFNMDNKIDDGAPGTGVVTAALSVAALNVDANYGAGDACVESATAYNTDTTADANTPACQLRFRFN